MRTSTALLVAAIVGVAAAAVVPWLLGTSTPVTARPDPAAAQVAPDLEAPPIESSEPRDARPRAEPAPSESAPVVAEEPEPPGARQRRLARATVAAARRASLARSAPREDAAAPVPDRQAPDDTHDVAPPLASPSPSLAYAPSSSAALLVAWSDPGGDPSLRAGWSSLPVSSPASLAPPTSAAWALASDDDRWYGASLPPSAEPITRSAGPGMGFLAQIDVAKAIASANPDFAK